MRPGPSPGRPLPAGALRTVHDIQHTLGVDLRVWVPEEDGGWQLAHPARPDGDPSGEASPAGPQGPTRKVHLSDRWDLEVELVPGETGQAGPEGALELAARFLLRALETDEEIRFFTYELSERFEEINLLYSISETLGSVLTLDEASTAIMEEVCDVLGARRGSLWVFDAERGNLHLAASVGDHGADGPIGVDDPLAVTAQVFRQGRPMILTRAGQHLPGMTGGTEGQGEEETVLSVPIRYTPPSAEPRTVGVINLLGRKRGGKFSASDQKLLSAIASQVGAALENNRLIRESLARERMAREMELAHNLQMKLLPTVESHGELEMAARVEPAEQVGGDFYHVLRLPGGRFGVMIGDVSSHGFPAALIMALSMSAASIFAAEEESPARVLRYVDDAIRDELETTEMYLTLFYGVLDPRTGELTYSNAGHPHAFLVPSDDPASPVRLLATDPPVGIAGAESYGQRTVRVGDGDLLLLFTDGLSDSLTEEAGPSGETRVLSLVGDHFRDQPGEIVENLFLLTEQSTSRIPGDDRTAVLLRGGPGGAER